MEAETPDHTAQRRRRGGRGREAHPGSDQGHAWRKLRNPFAPQAIFAPDRIAAMHDASLRVLEELGIRFLLDEARDLLRQAGARVDDETKMVRIGRDMVEAALGTAPKSVRMRSPDPAREQQYEPGAILFGAGAGCPNVHDRIRGRRPGSLQAFHETLKLQQHFDAIHILSPSAEPQDVPLHLRHFAMMRGQVSIGNKPLFIYARGRKQVEQSLEMLALAHGLDQDAMTDGAWCYTIINSNSPRQFDLPMSQGIIDFARAGQLCVITPFCLAGAMAPVTVAGALVLQHAEALAGIVLSQVAKPGAPVSYGGFSSNVDMKSGSPAFGTPEHVQAQLGSGQLARHIGLPWRSASGSAANTADAQGATENDFGLWGALMAQATLVIHSAWQLAATRKA